MDIFNKDTLFNRRRRVEYDEVISLGASGAIVGTTYVGKGVRVTKVAATTGRYLVELINGNGQPQIALEVFRPVVSIQAASPTAAYTAARATVGIMRGGSSVGTDGRFFIQLLNGVTDAEAEDSAKIRLSFAVTRGV